MNIGLIAFLLTFIIFAPSAGALLLAFFHPRAENAMRGVALGTTVLTFAATLLLLAFFDSDVAVVQPLHADGRLLANAEMVDGRLMADGEPVERYTRGVAYPWIENWNIFYRLGYDGISLPLVLLTGFISVLAMMASWSITKHI